MTKVVGVKFRNAGKVYYFAPGDQTELNIGTGVIVETARGLEFGNISMEPTDIDDNNVVKPLKPIIRIATPEDIEKKEENDAKRDEALRLCQEKIDKHGLEMKLIDVEYTFDNTKIVFYFTADGRVDFRELVKDLAGVFRMRIELRQVGVRDEAKLLGGCGPCGKGLCCATWMVDFQPVSIKMAKTQNLSLNPTKISGICGRLMCCLKYENDVYVDLRKGMPDVGEIIETSDGKAKVVDTNLLCCRIKARLLTGELEEDGSEKLSSETFTYCKNDIKRLGNKRNKQAGKSDGRRRGKDDRKNNGYDIDVDIENEIDILDEVDEEYKAEMEALMKD